MATTPKAMTIQAHRGAGGKPPVMRVKIPNRPDPSGPVNRAAPSLIRCGAGPRTGSDLGLAGGCRGNRIERSSGVEQRQPS
jgi:hypothetical protein